MNDVFRKAIEADSIDFIEYCRRCADNEQNPLYVWRALSTLFTLNSARRRAAMPEIPFPEWCVEHIAIIARRLTDLSEGLDFRKTPEPFGILPRTQESLEKARNRKRNLTSEDANNLVPRALGLEKDGWSAFERAWKLADYDATNLTVNFFRLAHDLSKNKAIEEVIKILPSRRRAPKSSPDRHNDPAEFDF